jgi:hypothetical protein
MSVWPSPRVDRLGTPKTPAIHFTRTMTFVASWFTHLLRLPDCSPPSTDLTTFAANGGFYIQAFNEHARCWI